MSNGARHGLGLLVGLIFIPLIGLALMYGTYKLGVSYRTYLDKGGQRATGGLALAGAAVLIGIAAGSRLSPLAALLPGAAMAIPGVVWLAKPRFMIEHRPSALPDELERGYEALGPSGIFLVIGLILLVAGLSPSRWRTLTPRSAAPLPSSPYAPARREEYGRTPSGPGYERGPFTPPPAPPGGQGPPPFDPAAAPQSPAPPPFDPSARPQPQGQPQPASSQGGPGQTPPKPESGQPAPDEPGEWTRMYGGDDFKGSR